MYEVIVLGATFAAAGIAQRYGDKCLVIERRAQAGYEFFGALHAIGEEADIHSLFECCCPVFCTQIVAVEKTDDCFVCVTHGVDGYRTYYAKKVVDTRCNAEMCDCKTFNLLIESAKEPAFADVCWEKAKGENRYILYCHVPLSCGYPQARVLAMDVIRQFSETQRLILSADIFDYRVKQEYPKVISGIWYLPSKAYENPKIAYEAGSSFGKEEHK